MFNDAWLKIASKKSGIACGMSSHLEATDVIRVISRDTKEKVIGINANALKLKLDVNKIKGIEFAHVASQYSQKHSVKYASSVFRCSSFVSLRVLV